VQNELSEYAAKYSELKQEESLESVQENNPWYMPGV
jgi:hypothetical protein